MQNNPIHAQLWSLSYSNLQLLGAGQKASVSPQRGRRPDHLQGDAALVLWPLEERGQKRPPREGHLSQVLRADLGQCQAEERVCDQADRDCGGNHQGLTRVAGPLEPLLPGEHIFGWRANSP